MKLETLNSSIVIIGDFDALALHPKRLAQMGIVPEKWQVLEPHEYTVRRSVIAYSEGIVLTVDGDKFQALQEGERSRAGSELASIAAKCVKDLGASKTLAVGANLVQLVEMDSGREWILRKYFNGESLSELKPEGAACTLIFNTPLGEVRTTIDNGQVSWAKTGVTKQGILIVSNCNSMINDSADNIGSAVALTGKFPGQIELMETLHSKIVK